MPNHNHIYDNEKKVCTANKIENVCPDCAAEVRHREMMNVLLDINQTLQQLLRNKLDDTSMMAIASKLDDIKYVLKYK